VDSKTLNDRLILIANVGVLVGLILLLFELKQNSDLMRLQIGQARADAAMLSNEQLFNSDYVPAILAKIQQGEKLTDEDRVRFVSFFRAFNRNQDNVLSQHREGMLGDNTPRSVADYACDFIKASDEHIEARKSTKVSYTDPYVAFIEEALTECR
jgi:hypothetical protein